MVDKEPQVVKEEGDREESPENSAKLPAIVKPDMPPPSFVPQVKSGKNLLGDILCKYLT